MTPRLVLVETSPALPGLLSFPSWDALAQADVVFAREPDAHPAVAALYFAGMDVEALEPAKLEMASLNLSTPGTPADRRIAKALLHKAASDGQVTYLMGEADSQLVPVISADPSATDVEIEIVFFAGEPRGAELLRMVGVMTRLRHPDDGCPWDLEQDHSTLLPYLIEEAYEFIEAVESGDDKHIAEELGDLLLQVLFHGQVAVDRGAFGIDDVARGLAEKLIRRHPHVFADGAADTADEVQANWDELKRQEKPERTTPFEGIPAGLPAVMRAQKVARRIGKMAVPETAADALANQASAAIAALVDGTADSDAVGQALLALTELAGRADIDAEASLRAATIARQATIESVLLDLADRGLTEADLDEDGWRQALA